MKNEYEFDLNIDETYKDETDCDEWGCAYLWPTDDESIGCEYNFAVEDGESYCTIYLLSYDGEHICTTNTSDYEHYDIEWGEEDWKERLKNKMIEFLESREGR